MPSTYYLPFNEEKEDPLPLEINAEEFLRDSAPVKDFRIIAGHGASGSCYICAKLATTMMERSRPRVYSFWVCALCTARWDLCS